MLALANSVPAASLDLSHLYPPVNYWVPDLCRLNDHAFRLGPGVSARLALPHAVMASCALNVPSMCPRSLTFQI